jgi:hypothetical protein
MDLIRKDEVAGLSSGRRYLAARRLTNGTHRHRPGKQGESSLCSLGWGEIIAECRWRTDRLVAFLENRPPARVILETCTEAFRIAALAQRAGHDVRVVAATLVRSLGVGRRGLKNDVRDARVLSEASCRMDLPSVHIPTAISQEVKAIYVSREALIKTRTQLIGRVRGYVRPVWVAYFGRHLRACRNESAKGCSTIPRDCPRTSSACWWR